MIGDFMTSWKTINYSRTMLYGVSFWPKSSHGNSVVLYLRRFLCPSSKIHNARTTIYSRGGQRDDLRTPQFKCNYGISGALIDPFFTCRLLHSVHQLLSIMSLLSSGDISKHRSMSASCTCKLPECYFYRQLVWATSVTCAGQVVTTPGV
jgi:hypothetical protein